MPNRYLQHSEKAVGIATLTPTYGLRRLLGTTDQSKRLTSRSRRVRFKRFSCLRTSAG
jgi:hypothetical protein